MSLKFKLVRFIVIKKINMFYETTTTKLAQIICINIKYIYNETKPI